MSKSITEIAKWQFKRYFITLLLVLILIYLGYSSFYQLHYFGDKVFLSKVVFEAIVMGFVGSLFFLAFLFSLKPNIKIADKICYNPEKDIYYFKMVNMSLIFPIRDVVINLEHGQIDEAIGEGNNIYANKVRLKSNSFTHIAPILFGLRNNIFAFIVQSEGSIDDGVTIKDILNDHKHNYIELSVYAKHSLSGFSIQKSKKYKNHQFIEDGEYDTGTSVDILPLNS